ncbi:hypothetical protein Tco_1536306 [Tanacetum coccineum]
MTHHEILSQILRQRPYQILIQTLQSILPQVPYFICTYSLTFTWSLSLVHADLSPPPKRIRDSDLVTDLEVSSEDGYEPYVPREVGLGVDVEDSYKPYTEPDVDFNIQTDIDECIAYADAIRARGTDDRDVVI